MQEESVAVIDPEPQDAGGSTYTPMTAARRLRRPAVDERLRSLERAAGADGRWPESTTRPRITVR